MLSSSKPGDLGDRTGDMSMKQALPVHETVGSSVEAQAGGSSRLRHFWWLEGLMILIILSYRTPHFPEGRRLETWTEAPFHGRNLGPLPSWDIFRIHVFT